MTTVNLLMDMVMNEPVNRNSRTAWTAEEMRFVEAHYGTLSAAEIGKQLGRIWASVKSMASRLKCCARYDFWSDTEVERLRTHYAAGTDMDTLLSMFPLHKRTGIISKVNTLGIFRRRWLEEENRILQKYYPQEGIAVAVRLPGRTVSAVQNQTYTLGLSRPRGRKWREEELILLEKKQHLPLSELQALLPGRSY